MIVGSWGTATIGEVLRLRYGKALPKDARDPAGPFPVLGSAGYMTGTHVPLVRNPVVLIGRKGNVGEVRLERGGCWPIDTTYFAEVPEGMDDRFLLHQLQHLDLKRLDSSTATPSLRRQDLEAQVLVLPPLAEQQRIIEMLEDHLSRLDAADQLLRDQVRRLRGLRSASIHLAVTEPCNQVPLRDLLSISIGGLWGNEAGGDEVDVRVLRVTELKRHGRLDPSTAARRSISTRQLESRALKAGDLLLEKSGGGPTQPVGRVGLVPQLDEVSICANFMQLMRPDTSRVDSRYLHLFLNDFHERGGTVPFQKASTNIRNLKASEYSLIPVPLPSLARQRQVVSDLELLLEQYALLERSVLQGVARGQGLRRSLLAAAFSGKLTGRHTDSEIIEGLSHV